MKKENRGRLLALAGAVGISACGMKVTPLNPTTTTDATDPSHYKEFPNYTGSFTGHTTAMSFGYYTSCDVDVDTTQGADSFDIKKLSYRCADGTTWGYTQPLHFELRKSEDRVYALWNVFSENKNVGYINYSNNIAAVQLDQAAGSISFMFSQSKDVPRKLEHFSQMANGTLLFKADPAKLTAK